MSKLEQMHVESNNVTRETADAKPEVPPAEMVPNLEPLFAGVDKFCNHILSLPAANHPDLKQLLAAIAASKEQLKTARLVTSRRTSSDWPRWLRRRS